MNAPLQYKTTHLICFSKTGFSLTWPTIFPRWTCIDKLHRYGNPIIKAWTVTEEGDCISEPKNKTKSGYSSQAKFTASTACICQFFQKINVWCTWTVQIILSCSIFCQFYFADTVSGFLYTVWLSLIFESFQELKLNSFIDTKSMVTYLY